MTKKKKQTRPPQPPPQQKDDRVNATREWVLLLTAIIQLLVAISTLVLVLIKDK
ncbi:hypothetical protein FLT15_16855 [Paenibacillus thiaminolyticus]|uniref:hypothetical protein n=1 Tax=Paenibacillus thiaminolyticus TaxID=49283 RepID=UPI0013F64AA7|nr:hypothetical protein [Paenibacillus thiaminolyticus]NGP59915.1 hypothetical protein [Paenibacillus thiaminolyticus]NGP59960.1 hypothetical protein [Paenibacillus thiaminolyticus]